MMKSCPGCRKAKIEKEFALNNQKPDGLQTYCKICKSRIDAGYYQRNKEAHKLRVKGYLIRNRKLLWEYLTNHSCVDCGMDNPVVLEFDHTGKDKVESISYLLGTKKCSWDVILREIKKCQVRCANCHRIKTAKQLGWYKFLAP